MVATIGQIARHCGVSRPTVSLILNNKGERYSPDTRQKVLRAAEEFGYLPNSTARAMARGEVSGIGMLVSTQGARSVVSGMLPGIHEEVRQRNLHLTLAELPDAKLTDEGFVPRILREYAVAGFLISYTHEIPAAMVELIEKHRIPSVWMNTKRPHDAVYPDDFAAARTLTEHLLGLGHRRIMYVTHQHNEHFSHSDRWNGYQAAMREAGLPVIDGRSERYLVRDEIRRHIHGVLTGEPRPTAVVCYESSEAENALAVALAAGLTVPRDLSIGVITEPVHNLFGLDFTACIIPFIEVGRQAVRMLLGKIDDRSATGDVPVPSVSVKGELYTGDTSAPPA